MVGRLARWRTTPDLEGVYGPEPPTWSTLVFTGSAILLLVTLLVWNPSA